jgi:hypothetical protein
VSDYIKLTQWLTLEDVRKLLATGEATVNAGGQIIDLKIYFPDRTGAQALVEAKPKHEPVRRTRKVRSRQD